MRTDPNQACQNEKQRFWWALLHDFLAHPLMALFGYPVWSLKLHDFTSNRAWPRGQTVDTPPPLLWWGVKGGWPEGRLYFRCLPNKIYEFEHPNGIAHTFRCNAESTPLAVKKALEHFEDLANRFGGVFAANQGESHVGR